MDPLRQTFGPQDHTVESRWGAESREAHVVSSSYNLRSVPRRDYFETGEKPMLKVRKGRMSLPSIMKKQRSHGKEPLFGSMTQRNRVLSPRKNRLKLRQIIETKQRKYE